MDEQIIAWIIQDDSDYDEYDEYDDDLVSLLFIDYVLCVIYINRIIYIQACWRRHRARQAYTISLHKLRFTPTLRDIIELAYLPPIQSCRLLSLGGTFYREGCASFYNNLNKYLKSQS